MTEKDWLKILEKDNREDWEWYARWLQDEEDNEIRANTVKWIIKEAKHPEHFKGNTIHAYYWYKDEYEYSIVDLELLNILNNYTKICKDYWTGYETLLEAKLALIEAWVWSKMGTCANRKSDLV
jgi:hypothetical protein